MFDWNTILTSSAIATFGASILAGIVQPHVQWGIEQKRERRKQRQTIIQDVRRCNGNYTMDEFREMSEYHAVRPFLDKHLIKKIESSVMHIRNDGPGAGVNNFWPDVMEQMSKLERKWGLV